LDADARQADAEEVRSFPCPKRCCRVAAWPVVVRGAYDRGMLMNYNININIRVTADGG
jgi:hypothetical protein